MTTAAALGGDRRARRRQETIAEILTIAEAVMTEQGVNGLSLSEVARRLGVKPPSIYKYFDSILAVYDALFERGQAEHLEVMRSAMAEAKPGLTALLAGLEASGRWSVAHPAMAHLMFWRPVPSFEASPEAMAPSFDMVQLQREALAAAVAAGELGTAGATDEALFVASVFASGTIGQALANEPELPWGEGRFSPVMARLRETLVALFPPPARRKRSA